MPAEPLRYLVAGLFNTLVGYLAFLAALHLLSLDVAMANLISYAAGLMVAYILNCAFVFKGRARADGALWKFLAGFAAAFAVNSGTLHLSHSVLHVRAELAQLMAMASYTVTFYFINKYIVFAGAHQRDAA